jgi:hypothetical protein
MEADIAISQLHTTEQAYMRQAAANKLQTLIKHETKQEQQTERTRTRQETYLQHKKKNGTQ